MSLKRSHRLYTFFSYNFWNLSANTCVVWEYVKIHTRKTSGVSQLSIKQAHC